MYRLSYHVPESHLDFTKQTIFDAGGGRAGNYDQCCWQVKGEGQFRPLSGSNPFVGRSGEVERIEEYLVEMLCDDVCVADAVAALKTAHPYEQPSYCVVRLVEV